MLRRFGHRRLNKITLQIGNKEVTEDKIECLDHLGKKVKKSPEKE